MLLLSIMPPVFARVSWCFTTYSSVMYKASNPLSCPGPLIALVVCGCVSLSVDVMTVESRVVESVLRIVC